MSAPRRIGLLLQTKLRLSLRRMSATKSGRLFSGVSLLFLLGFAGLLFVYTKTLFEVQDPASWGQDTAPPPDPEKSAHFLFTVVFTAQILMGFFGGAFSEGFDPSRLVHLPVRWSEAFVARVLGGILVPSVLVYLAPLLAWRSAFDNELSLGPAVTGILLSLLCGALSVSTFVLLFLRLFSMRRMQELGMVVASLVSVGGYALMSGAKTFAGMGGLDRADFWWSPGSWCADVALGGDGVLGSSLLVLVYLVVVGALGAWALRGAFHGSMPTSGGASKARSTQRSLGAFRTQVRLARQLVLREPMVKTALFRDLSLILLPVFFILSGDGQSTRFLPLVAVMLPFAHGTVGQSLFGFDGRGVGLLLLSPERRARLLFARFVGILQIVVTLDVLLFLALLLAGQRWAGLQVDGASVLAALGVLVVGNACMLAAGLIISVRWPVPTVSTGRRLLQNRPQNVGCRFAITRGLLVAPLSLLTLLVIGLVTLPFHGALFGDSIVSRLPGWAPWVGLALGLSLFAFSVFIGVRLASDSLSQREEEFANVFLRD